MPASQRHPWATVTPLRELNTSMDPKQQSFPQILITNLLAGLSVSFVAVSLGAAFGLLSGRGAFAGMISAGLIAIITSALGGTRIQCSGPTAPMTAVTTILVAAAHDQISIRGTGMSQDHFVNLVLILTGVLLVVMAVLRLGRFIALVPKVVVSGFMNGIAVLIWLNESKRLFGLGDKTAIGGEMLFNVLVALGTLAITFGFPPLIKKVAPSLAKLLPGTLVAILVATALTHAFALGIEQVAITGQLSSVADIVNLVQSQIPRDVSTGAIWLAAGFALQLALLAYLDTLLTALVMEKKFKEVFGRSEPTKRNKELAAQGLANAAVSLFGGIPGAQATIRSVLILNERATWRIAGVFVGVFVLIEMLLLQDYVSLIPQAVLTGVLFKVGYDVFDWAPIMEFISPRKTLEAAEGIEPSHPELLARPTTAQVAIVAATTIVTVTVGLNEAVVAFTLLFWVLRKYWKLRDLEEVLLTHED